MPNCATQESVLSNSCSHAMMLKSVFEHRMNFSNQLKRHDAKTRDFGKYIFQ